MKVLLVKTSSLGDVIHALPAVTEAAANVPGLELTWLVEEGFAGIPAMHPAVSRVIPVAIRRWRRDWWRARHEVRAFLAELKDTQYDLIIDSQGLIKSALISGLAKGPVQGYNAESARESIAPLFYRLGHEVDRGLHAVLRQKQLLSRCLGYETVAGAEYGLAVQASPARRVVFLHGTTWPSKEWPARCWQELAGLANADGYDVLVPAGNAEEIARAETIVENRQGRLLAKMPMAELAAEIKDCAGAISVDTGLGHLATALGLPVTAIFGSTNPDLTAMYGQGVEVIVSNHLRCIPCKKRECQYPIPLTSSNMASSTIYPPCLDKTTPERVWQAFQLQIGSKDTKPG